MAKAFIVPFVVYLIGTSIIAKFGDEWYPLAYAAVVILTAVVLGWLLDGKLPFQVHPRVWPGLVVGFGGIALWIAISHLQLEQRLAGFLPEFMRPEERMGYNPFQELQEAVWVWPFIFVRLLGIAVVVPLVEELFWRGFLLRWLIDPDWEKVPVGEYTLSSCAIVTVMFTLAHPEWLAAAVYALLINALLYWQRDLWQCVVAHATSNFVLAAYVLCTGAWWLW